MPDTTPLSDGTEDDRPRVGFVGLGDMGGAMARRVIDAGFPTNLWARRAAAFHQFPSGSYSVAPDLVALGRSIDVALVCVFADEDVRQVCLQPGGLLAGMEPGGTVFIHSTTSPALCEEIAAAAHEVGVYVLDAPVSGARAAAEAGELTVMVGGDAAAFERRLPVLQAFGSTIRLLGPLGSGQKTKTLNNVLGFCNGRLASIALETSAKLGLDLDATIGILRTSGGRSFALDSLTQKLMPDPVFTAHAAQMVGKDTRLFQQICRDAGVERTVLDELAEQRMENMVPDV